MFLSSKILGIPSSETSSLQGKFDEHAAAGALLSFTTPPSSQGSPSREPWGMSSDSAPATGGFFPAQSGFWDGCPVQNEASPEVQAAVSSIKPLSATHHSMFTHCLDDGIEIDVIPDKAVMAQKLALVRVSKVLNESPEMKEAAGLLAVLQTTPAPWYMGFNERVAHHHNSDQQAVNGMDNVEPDATEEEAFVVLDQQEVETPTTSAPPISARAAGKQREKCDSPALVNSSHSATLPTANSTRTARKAPLKRKAGAKGSASTQTTARNFEFVNQTASSIGGHKRRRAPPTPRKSAGSGRSPTGDVPSQTSSANPAESLPTPPLRTMSASTLEVSQRKSTVVKSKLSRTPDGIDDEEEDGKGKQERTSSSGRTIKNTKKWTTSEYCRR
ncbi:hypothetical protein MMC17_001057 [Xylographa soralifera]|nr:hypothetical protein [Xylographa soralifera]